jgi:CRP-like cAMP-binding protein/predicted MFS family arabinose efflux permease
MGGKAGQRDGYRSALRSRDLRRLLASQVISSTGSWAYSVALAVLLYERTGSTTWVAAGSLGRFIPSLLFSAYGGVIAERFERIALMVRLNLISLALQLGLALVAWRDGPIVFAIVLAALTSMVQTAYNPSVAAVIPQVTREDDLAAANALSGTIDNLVIILGPAIGAGLLVFGGPALTVLVNAISFGVAAAVVSTLRARSRPSDVTDGGNAGPMRQIADGFRAVTSSSTAAVFVAFSVLASFVYGTDTVLFVPISSDQLHTGASGYGYLLAGLGVGGLVGAAAVNRLAASPRLAPAILGGMAVYCLPTALLVVVDRPAIAFVLQVARGAGTLVVDTLAITALQRSVPKEMVARVFGVFFALVLAAISLGALVTPLLLGVGLHVAMLSYGLGIPALCLLTMPRLLAMDRVAAARAGVLAPRVAILERLDLFAAASRSSLERLAGTAVEVEVPAGCAVVVEGAVADAFYVVLDGELEVSAIGENAAGPVRLRTLGPETYFGEIGLIGRIARTATVTAHTACTLLRIDGGDFLDALTNLSASPSLLEGARTRLSLTHPSSTALLEQLRAPDNTDASEIAHGEVQGLSTPPVISSGAVDVNGDTPATAAVSGAEDQRTDS